MRNGRHTCTYTHTTLDFACTNAHTSRGAPLVSASRIASITYTDKQLSTGDLVGDDINTLIPIPTLDSLHKRPFLLHAYWSVSLTRTQHYTQFAFFYSSVGRVFLVETVVLQTVLWDIRAWIARFQVNVFVATFERLHQNLWWLIVVKIYLTLCVCRPRYLSLCYFVSLFLFHFS